jgi:CheY-like chemotaxis protein
VAADGKDVLEMAHVLRPVVITLDVMMPHVDGWQLLVALKLDPDMQDIPVILVTLGEGRTKGLALGVSGYLIKSMERQHLLYFLRQYQYYASMGNIFVVDNDPVNRGNLSRTVAAAGYDIAEAGNGFEALAYLESNDAPLGFLDLMTSAMDGFKVLQVLRTHDQWKRLLVVVVTAKEWTAEELIQLADSVQSIQQKGFCVRGQLSQDIDDLITLQLPRHNSCGPTGGVHA